MLRSHADLGDRITRKNQRGFAIKYIKFWDYVDDYYEKYKEEYQENGEVNCE